MARENLTQIYFRYLPNSLILVEVMGMEEIVSLNILEADLNIWLVQVEIINWQK